jgi:hypothetical protein
MNDLSTPLIKDSHNNDRMIIDYLNLINPLSYDEVKVGYVDELNLYLIIITVGNYTQHTEYNKSVGSENSILQNLTGDMKDMFPYVFRLNLIRK